MLIAAHRERRRVYVMGNGGSAATATHLVCDLFKTAQVSGVAPLRAFALTDNNALLTALANDHGYASVFAACVNRSSGKRRPWSRRRGRRRLPTW
jgi:D-sedoheptulose 7-phosphate isomerase